MSSNCNKPMKQGIWDLLKAKDRIRGQGCPLGLELESYEGKRRRFKASKKRRGRR